jgi:hypothetical protein
MKHVVTTVTITDDLGGVGESHHAPLPRVRPRLRDRDLNKRNQETFQRRQDALYAPYIAAARDVTDIEEKRAPAIRAWAAQNGIEVNNRGRIPEDIIRQYDEAQEQS